MCFLKRATSSKPVSAKEPTENTGHKQLPRDGFKQMATPGRASPGQAKAKPARMLERVSFNLSSSTSSGQHSAFSRESTSSDSLVGVRQLVSDGAVVYKYKDLSRATDHFNSSRSIGGSVYRASLLGVEVAITRKKYEGQDMDFLPELKLLCSVHHTNIVKLMGGCFVEGDCVYLVHELAEGANLRHALRSPANPDFCLLASWTSRLQVALDVAKALEYLHDYAYPTYVHKLIQSSNIIIDNDLRAKIAKFGVSKLTGDSQSPTAEPTSFSRSSGEHSTSSAEIQPETGAGASGRASPLAVVRPIKPRSGRIITGTLGYMPPEYLSSGIASLKYDVYSFGVILLELLSGQEPMGFVRDQGQNVYRKTSITDAIFRIMDDSEDSRMKLRVWMDPLLREQYPLDSAYKTAALAKSCVDPNPTSRPHMRDVAVQLSKLLTTSTLREASMAAAKNLMSGPVEAR